MTNIIDYIRDLKEKRKHYSLVGDEAKQKFDSQADNLERISGTKGYKAIQEFWILQLRESVERLKKVNPNDKNEIVKTQARLELAEKFTNWLDARVK